MHLKEEEEDVEEKEAADIAKEEDNYHIKKSKNQRK